MYTHLSTLSTWFGWSSCTYVLTTRSIIIVSFTFFWHLTILIKKINIRLWPSLSSPKTESDYVRPSRKSGETEVREGNEWCEQEGIHFLRALAEIIWCARNWNCIFLSFDCFPCHTQMPASQTSTYIGNQCSLAQKSWSLSYDEGWVFHISRVRKTFMGFESIISFFILIIKGKKCFALN